MCTVTLIPIGSRHRSGGEDDPSLPGWRLACNRDEQRTRKRALPPRIVAVGRARRAIMPVDPESDGSWIAINDAGLAATLLNANALTLERTPARPPDDRSSDEEPRRSRGSIVPRMMGCDDLEQAQDWLEQLDPRRFSPFRLVVCHGSRLLQAWCDGISLATSMQHWHEPMMFTSSGLGDAVVEPPRRGLFRQLFDVPSARWPQAQDAFHRHRFPGQPHLSVNMSRADARTVSLTVIECSGAQARMIYHGDAPDSPSAQVDQIALPLLAYAQATR